MESKASIPTLLRSFGSSVLRSYGQIFFSDHIVFSGILVLVTFFDFYAGLAGMISIFTSIAVAQGMGYEKEIIQKGVLGFNGLLVGLGLGIFFEPGIELYVILVLSSVFTLFLTIGLRGITSQYALPFMSLPFLFSFWTFTLATRNFEALGISQRGIYTMNDFYQVGGNQLVAVYDWWNQLALPQSLRIYFISLGAVLFQFNVFSGILITAGLLIYSRIAFSLSLLGFFTAYAFYQLIGASMTEFSYSLIGFNYILTSIAIGGFFVVPGWKSYLWVLILIPLVAVLTNGLSQVFSVYQVSIYSLPFNLIVLLFIYALKFRFHPRKNLTEVGIQQNSPEKNVYSWLNDRERFKHRELLELSLPFWGEWTVSQAKDGEYTHQGPWRHAWDFVVTDEEGKQFRNEGNFAEDYFCFDRPVLAPADGIIEAVADHVRDNIPGAVNTQENWGNHIIIKHRDYLYSSLGHLRGNSITVHPGDQVKAGQIIAHCGSSGRSPYPHLHFQLQWHAYTGAVTLEYPLSNFIRRSGTEYSFLASGFPLLNDCVANIEPDPFLVNAFNLIPGKRFKLEVEGLKGFTAETWEVHTSVYNESYIWCPEHKSSAWFTSSNKIFYFAHFSGSQNSLLYYFYLAFYKVQKGFYPSLVVHDQYPVNMLFRGPLLWLQDFLVPFHVFLKPEYSIRYESVDNKLSPTSMVLRSSSIQRIGRKKGREINFVMHLNSEGIHSFEIADGKQKGTVRCIAL